MCIPIFPNEVHPAGRAALHTEPAFPFSGCYLWALADTAIRVVPKAEGWKPREAVLLPPLQRVEMRMLWEVDLAEVQAATAKPKDNEKGTILTIAGFNAVLIPTVFGRAEGTIDDDSDSNSETNTSSKDSSNSSEPVTLGPPSGEEAELDPVVELWYELTEHMKDEDILPPSEFYNEIIRIIRCDRS